MRFHRLFDVYITTKKLGSCSLRRITVPGGMEIQTDARNFVGIMQRISQGEASIEETEELERLRHRLYHAVISPVLRRLKDTRRYISHRMMNCSIFHLNAL